MHNSPRRHLRLPSTVLRSLVWWTHDTHLMAGMSFQPLPPSKMVTTDASLLGWGAHLDSLTVQCTWRKKERQHHMNYLELLAVLKALRAFDNDLRGCSVLITTDNTTVMYHINKQGGTRSRILVHLTLHLWQWCIRRHIVLTAVHIPGTSKILADALSRTLDVAHEWQLHQKYL